MIDRLTLEASIAQQFGAVLKGGRYMVGDVDVTQGVNWMFDSIINARLHQIEPIVEAWDDDPHQFNHSKKRMLKKEWPLLHTRMEKLVADYKELKHG